MAEPEVPEYAWLRDYSRSKIATAACITVATRVSREDVLFAFGADPGGEALPWSSQVGESLYSTVAVVVAQDAVVAVEYNGSHGAGPEVLVPLSRAARAASLLRRLRHEDLYRRDRAAPERL